MPFALNPAPAIDDIIEFDIPSNIKLYRRAKKKLEYELYNFVLQYLFNFLESLSDRATKFK